MFLRTLVASFVAVASTGMLQGTAGASMMSLDPADGTRGVATSGTTAPTVTTDLLDEEVFAACGPVKDVAAPRSKALATETARTFGGLRIAAARRLAEKIKKADTANERAQAIRAVRNWCAWTARAYEVTELTLEGPTSISTFLDRIVITGRVTPGATLRAVCIPSTCGVVLPPNTTRTTTALVPLQFSDVPPTVIVEPDGRFSVSVRTPVVVAPSSTAQGQIELTARAPLRAPAPSVSISISRRDPFNPAERAELVAQAETLSADDQRKTEIEFDSRYPLKNSQSEIAGLAPQTAIRVEATLVSASGTTSIDPAIACLDPGQSAESCSNRVNLTFTSGFRFPIVCAERCTYSNASDSAYTGRNLGRRFIFFGRYVGIQREPGSLGISSPTIAVERARRP